MSVVLKLGRSDRDLAGSGFHRPKGLVCGRNYVMVEDYIPERNRI